MAKVARADGKILARGAGQSATAPSAGKGVIERILDGAEAVLREHGYAGFTTRRVAENADIAPGNLSYHFPTKLGLIRAVVERRVTLYTLQFQAALRTPGLASGHDLEALVRWLLTDSTDAETVWLFRELWVIALRDKIVRAAVDDFYDQLMDGVATALQTARPTADPKELRRLVQFLALLSEGSVVLYGTRLDRVTPHAEMVDTAVRMIEVIAPTLAG